MKEGGLPDFQSSCMEPAGCRCLDESSCDQHLATLTSAEHPLGVQDTPEMFILCRHLPQSGFVLITTLIPTTPVMTLAYARPTVNSPSYGALFEGLCSRTRGRGTNTQTLRPMAFKTCKVLSFNIQRTEEALHQTWR